MGTSKQPKWRRKMIPVSRWLPGFARIATSLILFAAIIFVALRVAAPYLVSSGLVRSGIEDVLSKWTGYQAEIKGTPVLEFWPTPRITLNQITIRQPESSGNKLLGTIESLSADFSLIDAIRGSARFHEFHLLRPNLSLTRDQQGLIDWTYAGQLAKAITSARQEGGAEVLDQRLDATIGAITVEDGTLNVADLASGKTYHFEGVTADITWPRLSSPMTAVLIARTSGEDLKLDFSSNSPLLIFGGKVAQIKTALTSKLMTAEFTGIGGISGLAGLSGNMSVNIPDLPALLAWSGKSIPDVETLRSFSIESDIFSAANGLRFNEVVLGLNDANATGVMDISIGTNARARLGGTLAFDRMNLKPFFDAFTLRLAAGEAGAPEDGGPLQKLDVDLRLSAKEMQLPPFQLSDVGASIIVSSNEAKFDIGDSQFEGGEMTAHLEATRGNFDGGGKLQVSIRGADFAGLIERLQLKGPLPLANGSLDISLKTNKPIWTAGAADVSGQLAFRGNAGSIAGLDVEAIRSQAAQQKFFPLSAVSGRAFEFNRIDVAATLADGSAELRGVGVQGTDETLTLSGIIPYESNGLALSGSLQATDDAKKAVLPLLPFFVGGSWPNPVISPVPLINQQPPGVQ
ncbi:AsmA family protein [Rhizobium mongolense]|uniref:AsmA protein n=2 Tax=Rhizobium mongolense TaxID=57676 RepID=A0A559SS08_9HYPH|nr:AsmA family protein [Rhizobium mongolense]TVZ65131.1 AsmA protein [Rhizobium mongolense USDA 1844]